MADRRRISSHLNWGAWLHRQLTEYLHTLQGLERAVAEYEPKRPKSMRPDYEREDLGIYSDGPRYVVNDPWTAQDRGFFYTRKDAELFVKALKRKARKAK